MEQTTQKLTLLDKNSLQVTGVEEILSFDENQVVLSTSLGILRVEGADLHLKSLSPEGGLAQVKGSISSLSYPEGGIPGGWLSRLFK